eukprot:CAMPEP_0206614008 /NCGR_PEP_ID=MMETSP0325_2-20121206/57081_1 /ASSEMBLY_ACC=CAM_ASM_000347 /TAXON_ID=2866 /ORGANISM="Crypthecodinium cohnii, Strain Seligo" /LENGTH=36 /DNA_ID= /DNA_START= /DNA_END= /DNA_ORIENTATION=
MAGSSEKTLVVPSRHQVLAKKSPRVLSIKLRPAHTK